ncbi:fatty-acid amide hydrolase 2-like [Condylostylus longicornis]|uniref:fatty-acid amide hydrolase 2-like n=1 Tax=Condylostylus longicornis TaxID=2530218 RepID=UPI00244E54F6|nr:fatty-acid amide hydrolase 2-like [Condylostylus longicornis]
MNNEILHINYSCKKSKNSKPTIIEKSIKIVYSIFLLFVRQCVSIIYGKGERAPPIRNKILLEPVTSLAEKIRNGELKSVDLVKYYISRIRDINPILNCMVENRFEDAISDAYLVDTLIESKKFTKDELAEQKPLLGIPFTTKDSIQIKNMLNTAGLWLRKDYRADENAKTITLLLEAGAIPLAITNVPELCMWWECSNLIYGRTNNPYDTNRTVGGSSGGEGCIQASCGSAFGLGSDMGGSIRIPAFCNGIFGHKPTKFIVSNHGQFPSFYDDEKEGFLSMGPMCRHATDLKLILKIIANDKRKYLNLDEKVDIKNIKFFYQIDDGGAPLVQSVDKEIQDALKKIIQHISNETNENPKQVQFEKLRQSFEIFDANVQNVHGIGAQKLLTNLNGNVNPYTELGKMIIGRSKHTFMGVINALFEEIGISHGSNIYYKFVEKRDVLLKEIQDLLGDNGVLLYPTHPTVAPYHFEPIARVLNFSYTAVFNTMGFPCTTIPMGIGSEGLPLGIQVIANHNQDRLCLAVAEELEKAFGGWVPPSLELEL